MSALWQVQEAKNRFSELIERAVNEGPQTVTRHGKPVVRVVAVGGEGLAAPGKDDGFVEFLLSMPRVEGFAELIGERSSVKQLDPLGE
ncbi:type II toxin-antitoxin system Phd/YefM family antitoxin [Pulveribacter suum]|uniref:Antitoxin n=1 Tax=Pulveribacter suum TaxID=2116657 RepID=A0A2P1NJT0_9BURK|nr:type II toxin-antitoxin system Phd/YefM family antitoxin [Pulveribacter suum]AVP57305.1 type II toxin-antitoxin system Phd/YefM family antitoxin [Pulveribacter suum]